MSRKLMLSTIILLIVVALVPMPTLRTAHAADGLFAAPTGPNKVGTVIRYLTDQNRDEFFADDPATRRELMVQIWYPADVKADAKLAPYLDHSDQELAGFEQVL